MKLGPVTKLDKRKKATWQEFGGDVISENFNVIVNFSDLWLKLVIENWTLASSFSSLADQ